MARRIVNKTAEWQEFFDSDECPLFYGFSLENGLFDIVYSHHTFRLCLDTMDAAINTWGVDREFIVPEEAEDKPWDCWCQNCRDRTDHTSNEVQDDKLLERCLTAKAIFRAYEHLTRTSMKRLKDSKFSPPAGREIPLHTWNSTDWSDDQFIKCVIGDLPQMRFMIERLREECQAGRFGFFSDRFGDDDHITAVMAFGQAWNVLSDCICHNESKTSNRTLFRIDIAREWIEQLNRGRKYRNKYAEGARKAEIAKRTGGPKRENRCSVARKVIKKHPGEFGSEFVNRVANELEKQTHDLTISAKTRKIMEPPNSAKQRATLAIFLKKEFPERFLRSAKK